MSRPPMPNREVGFPDSGDGLFEFDSFAHFDICGAVALKDAMGPRPQDARCFVRKLRANWVRDTAHRHKRILAGAQGANERLLDIAYGEVG